MGTEIAHTISERKILARNTNPYLVNLKYSFQSEEKIYFVLDYISGGELFVHLQRETHFSEPRAKLYAAMLICALNHLHCYSIIYRDIKPENILIDRNGFIKLTDFGLCKEEVGELMFAVIPHGSALQDADRHVYQYTYRWTRRAAQARSAARPSTWRRKCCCRNRM